MAAPPGLHRSNLADTIWPPVLLGADAILAALVSQLVDTERLSMAEIEALQGRQLSILIGHHRSRTPAFAARLKAAGLTGAPFDSVAALRRLPPITRREVQRAGAAFFALAIPDSHGSVHDATTSGSTGETVTVRKSQLQGLFWDALMLRDLAWRGYDFGARITTIRAQVTRYYEMDGWGRPVDALYDSGRAQGIPIETDVREQLRLMRRFKPGVLSILPSNLMAMVQTWESQGFSPKSLRRVRTLGETVKDDLRMRLAAVAGIEIEDHYSAQETGSLAIQCPRSGLYHVMAESVIIEVIGPDGAPCSEGETGRVVVTDLHNLATPLIRYEIGDYAEVGGECPCGRGLPTLRRILGRERNLIVMPNGERHWPVVSHIEQALGRAVGARQYQLIQRTRTALEFRMVCDRPQDPSDDLAVRRIVQTALGHPFEIEIVRFEDALPVGPNGKFEDFLCLVPMDAAA